MWDNAATGPVDLSILRYVDPDEVRVYYGEDGRLYATILNTFTVVAPRFFRVCPLTDPDRYISIRGMDPNGREYALIRDWRRLDPESKRLVEAELQRRYLHPKVRRIISLQEYSGVKLCTLDTDRGVHQVTLRDLRDNVIYLGASRVLITDAESNRFDIDLAALDGRSRHFLAQIL